MSLKLHRDIFITDLALCGGLAWLDARCPPKLLYKSPYSTGQGRKNMAEGL